MNRIVITYYHFSKTKFHFGLLFILCFFTNIDLYSQKSHINTIPLITVDDTLNYNIDTKKRELDISKYQDIIILKIDSSIIKKYNLVKYRFLLNTDTKKTVWIDYPYKELIVSNIHKKNTLKIQAKDNKGYIYTDILTINTSDNKISILDILFLLIGLFIILTIYLIRVRILKTKYLLATKVDICTKELSLQKKKYKELLTNNKLKGVESTEKDKTQRFKMVTVLFSNILGFTKVADQDNAKQLIDDIDRFFFKFDEVVKKLHIEKIKSVGDSYMCAGGIPKKNRTNPIEVVLAAFEMQQYMNSIKEQYITENKKIWDLRMGIHTGPVFSNNRKNKNSLDIWGDTVNIASRMEASGKIGKVNITGMTYELVKDYFLCQYRGKMPVKYKGELDMYFIEGFRPKLSADEFGLKPNKLFETKLSLIRFDDLEEFVMNMLEDKLPKNLYYHNLKHTIDVIVQVEIIGRHEEVKDEEILLLKTAALFHDSGFIKTYKNHEEAGVEICKAILPAYDYTEEQIKIITDLIMVTKLPPKPKTHLEKIILDADLDYLGRVDFVPVSGNLFKELIEYKLIDNDIEKWNKIQFDFISKHQYFTNTAKRLRDVNKNHQLEIIKRLVEENN
jgi:class 3 adenylate cyclase